MVQPESTDGFRLSPPQRRLLSLYQEDENSSYLAHCAIYIAGGIDPHLLEIALHRVAQSYEIFRTNFCGLSKETAVPLQIIQENSTLSVDYYDLSYLNTKDQQEQIVIFSQQEHSSSFDYANGSLLRVKLLKLAADQFVLLLCLPALCADSTTLKYLAQEIGRFYGVEEQLANASLQYADVAEWLNEVFSTEEGEAGMAYWRQYSLEQWKAEKLPIEKEHSGAFTPKSLSVLLPIDVVQRYRVIAEECDTHFSVLILTAWQVLLGRILNQADLVIGVAGNGRNYEELEDVLGPLTKYLPLRCQICPDELFSTLVANVQTRLHEVYEWQECFDWEQFLPGKVETKQASFFPFCFDFVDMRGAFVNGGITFSLEQLYANVDRFKIKLTCLLGENDSLHLVFHYNANIFQKEDVQHLAGQLLTFAEGVAYSPKTPVAYIPVLERTEYDKLIVEFNDTGVVYPQEKYLYHLFEDQVALMPHRVALQWGYQNLTYAELNKRANQLAHYLRKQGVVPEDRVAICLDRSPDMIIALLGVLKAGGVYVPLSPSYPQERLLYMLKDIDPAIFIYQGETSFISEDIKTLTLKDKAIDQESKDNPKIAVMPDNPAYILYTSGSTGYPKGVMITHRNLTNYLTWCIQTYGSQPDQTSILHSPISFDLTVTSLYVPLLTGQLVHLISEAGDLEDLSVLWQGGTNPQLMKMTPAHLKAMAQLLNMSEMTNKAGTLVIGGEQLLAEDVRPWCENVPGIRIFNEYGPTEATVGCCVYEITALDSVVIPIGYPIANVQLYLLDTYLQPVPIGITGELYIGGTGLARGYRNQPALTAKTFIPDPFSKQAGGRIYRTGDMARFRLDGKLEFVGRYDHQVKLRGFRIELGEIEAILRQHPALYEGVVLIQEEASGAKHLVACVVPDTPKHVPGVIELQQYLQQKLPDYMIPAHFVFLRDIPLTPNAKVDREALRTLLATKQKPTTPFVAPRTAVENTLAKIWAKLLRREQVGIYDNFFELGGDSILSIQVVTRAKQSGLHFTLGDMFTYQTIAELVPIVQSEQVLPAEQRVVTGPVPLTPIQRWFFEQKFDEPSHWNQALTIALCYPLNTEWLARTLVYVITHHDALRLRFTHKADTVYQTHAAPDEVGPLLHFDLSGLPPDTQATELIKVHQALQVSLNISDGPILRVAYIDQGTQQILSIIVHHLVIDAVSWQIFLEDLAMVYLQLSRGERVSLPAKTSSFQQWSNFLQSYAQTIDLQEALIYWGAAGMCDIPQLPVDFDAGHKANRGDSADTVSVFLTERETESLLQGIARLDKVSINDVLLTALLYALSRWTTAELFWIDMEGHGREDLATDIDVSRTVGWFTSLFPLLLKVEGKPDIGSLVKVVKEQLYSVPGHGFSYGLLRFLREESAVQLSQLPSPGISFNYLGQWDDSLLETTLFNAVQATSGPARSPQALRPHLLAVNGMIVKGQLQIDWTYSQNLHRRETIHNLAQYFIAALHQILKYSQFEQVHSFTPSDYPLAHLTQSQLDELIALIGMTEWRNNVEDVYELSSAQQGMFFHTLHTPERGTHVEQLHGVFDGELNVRAFQDAWQQVINQHTALRTSFHLGELDKPVQLVHRQAQVPLVQYDWTGLSKVEQSRQLATYLRTERDKGFDMNDAPLMRLTLIRVAETTHHFVVTFHHILVDGWSTALIFRDVFALYEQFKQGANPRLERVAPYKDYIAWLQGQDLRKAEEFWRKNLKDYTEPLALSMSGESVPELIYGQEEYPLTVETTNGLNFLSKKHYVTLNSVIQAAWGIVLSGYSNKDDVVFGVTVSGRPTELLGVETMVGLFINTLPVRIHVSPTLPVSDYVSQHHQRQLELHQYLYTPLTQVHKWSDMAIGVPLFDHIIVFENFPHEKRLQNQGGLQIHKGSVITARTNYAFTMLIIPDTPLTLRIVYDTCLLDREAVVRVLTDFGSVLTGMIAETATVGSLLEQIVPSLRVHHAHEQRQVASSASFTAPRTLTESRLVRIWSKVLGLEQVSVFDNVLNLGGHSLLITQIASQVREAFRVELPLRTFFEHPILIELAEQIDETHRHHKFLRFPPIEPVSRRDQLPLSYAQERLWILNQIEPNSVVYNIPVAVWLSGELDTAALKRSFREVIRRHEVLRTRFEVIVEDPVQIIMSPDDIRFSVVVLTADKDAKSIALEMAKEEIKRPFDLRQAAPLRLTLYVLGNSQYLLLITVHHIAADDWSMRILMSELVTLYNTYRNGELSSLPELSVQYADYAHWERTWLTQETLEIPLNYWKKQLSGKQPLLNLPTDHPRPAIRTYQGKRENKTLSQSLLNSLQAFSQQQEVTAFVTLLAVFNTLLYRYTSQNDMLIGIDIANRYYKQTEGLIGFFVNQSILRSFPVGHHSFLHLLQQIRQTIYEGWAYQDVPFNLLVKALHFKRDTSRSSLFQVKMDYIHVPTSNLSPVGVTLDFVELRTGEEELELILFVTEQTDALLLSVGYSTDLFDATTIQSFLANFEEILVQAMRQPETLLDNFELEKSDARRHHNMKQSKSHKRTSLTAFNPQTVQLSQQEMVRVSQLQPECPLPLVVEPALPEVEIIDWIKNQRTWVEEKLLQHGAILLRGFELGTIERFEAMALSISPNLFQENGEHTPVSADGSVQVPVFYAPSKKLLWHNENSFNHNWPLRIMFACAQPAEQGGETPLVDSRQLFEQLPASIRKEFVNRQVMYVRTYGDQLGKTWQEVFSTPDRARAEAICQANYMEYEWLSNGWFQTRAVRPAVINHPLNGAMSWFNQAQHWHVACLDTETRATLSQLYGPELMPRNCYFGDGTLIPDEMILEILSCYEAMEVSFPWQQGDALIVDNVLLAHGRNPYVGQRKLLVALGDMYNFA